MPESNLFHSVMVSGKNEFWKNIVYNGKFENNQGVDVNFVEEELIHTNKEVILSK